MAEEKATLREVHWRHVFPWIAIFRSFGVALDLKKMALGGLGVVLMSAGWWVLAYVFPGTTETKGFTSQVEQIAHWPWDPEHWNTFVVSETPTAAVLLKELERSGLKVTAADQKKIGALQLLEDLEKSGIKVTPSERTAIEEKFGVKEGISTADEVLHNPLRSLGQLATNWRFVLKPVDDLMRPFRRIFAREGGFVTTVFALVCGIWGALVWAFFGGAITRIAAVQFAREEKISLKEAVQFATSKYLSYSGAPVIPLGFIAFFAILCLIGGFISWIFAGAGAVFAGVLWFLPLLAGFVMALILVGWAVGWPLMYSTISVEGSDSFDALSRSFAYVFQRPWHYLFYGVLAVVFGSLCSYFVIVFTDLVVHVTRWAVAWGGGEKLDTLLNQLFWYAPVASGWRPDPPPEAPTGLTKFGALCTAAWLYLLFLLLVGFVYSYFWSASTIIYYLLRRDVDNTEMQEVFLEGEEEDGGTPSELTPQATPVVTSGQPSPSVG